jgi:dUTP pyrophosphatase
MLVSEIFEVERNGKLPVRATVGSIGLDMFAAETAVIQPQQRKLISTDCRLRSVVNGYFTLHDRSGLALKHGIHLFAGVIDGDYLGIIGAVLFNSSFVPFDISVGDRICQIIPHGIVVSDATGTMRGSGGFGSTGISNICNK